MLVNQHFHLFESVTRAGNMLKMSSKQSRSPTTKSFSRKISHWKLWKLLVKKSLKSSLNMYWKTSWKIISSYWRGVNLFWSNVCNLRNKIL